MVGLISRADLQFDLFDALGLNPTNGSITVTSIHRRWRRVNLQIHPDKLANARYIPIFPTYTQAQKAKDYLLAEDNKGASPESRIQAALSSGKASYRSTWNPWATPNTEHVLKPIPGASSVETHKPAKLEPDGCVPEQQEAAPDNGGWTAERLERWWTGSELPDWEGRMQWAEEELRRERQAKRDRGLRSELREKRRRMKRRKKKYVDVEGDTNQEFQKH
ncbi:hypothetical protein MMC26_000757 [Xylographa opegraphella]|nr:hypothetical protein [Xylographa opegraphella]